MTRKVCKRARKTFVLFTFLFFQLRKGKCHFLLSTFVLVKNTDCKLLHLDFKTPSVFPGSFGNNYNLFAFEKNCHGHFFSKATKIMCFFPVFILGRWFFVCFHCQTWSLWATLFLVFFALFAQARQECQATGSSSSQLGGKNTQRLWLSGQVTHLCCWFGFSISPGRHSVFGEFGRLWVCV